MPIEYVRLRERLLRAGVAPRHVHRYVRELRDHYDDLVQAEIARGSERGAAEATASARLGSEDDLARSVLARPELRSIASRFPALAFGAGPAIAWLSLLIATGVLIRTAGDRVSDALGLRDAAVFAAAHAVCIFHVRIAPLLLSAAMVIVSARQRATLSWPIAGTVVLCVLAARVSIQVVGRQLGVSSALLPFLMPQSDLFGPMSVLALAKAFARAALMLVAVWSPLLFWRRRAESA
jgi:hypothetical protein